MLVERMRVGAAQPEPVEGRYSHRAGEVWRRSRRGAAVGDVEADFARNAARRLVERERGGIFAPTPAASRRGNGEGDPSWVPDRASLRVTPMSRSACASPC